MALGLKRVSALSQHCLKEEGSAETRMY